MLPVRDFEQGGFVLMATAYGIVKKTLLTDYSRPRSTGIIAVDLLADDQLVGVDITDGEQDVMLFTSGGKVIRFNEAQVRPMGRAARGVKGIQLGKGQRVISQIIPRGGCVLSATGNGFGKRTAIDEYRLQGRGGQGVIAMQTGARNGPLVSAILVNEDDDMMLITDGGTLVRTRVAEVPVLGRNTQGVKLISLSEGEKLVGIEPIIEEEEE